MRAADLAITKYTNSQDVALMKILHVLDHSLPLHSGYVFRTISILKQQRQFGFETAHLTTPRHTVGDAVVEAVDGWEFYRTRLPDESRCVWPVLKEMLEMRATMRRLDEVFATVRPDIIHAHSPVLNALPAWRVAKRHHVPFVYEVRAFWEDAAVDHGSIIEGSLRYRVGRALETFVFRQANALTTICQGLRSDIVARGIDAAKITVVPNAVNVDEFTTDGAVDPVLQARLNLRGKSVIGFIGSFYAYEGLDLLLDALAILVNKCDNIVVMLVGGGPQDEALQAQARRLGLVQNVKFVGRVPHSEVQSYYNLVDVLCYPRKSMRLTELVTPLKPLEAMAQGRIVLASDVGGHRELIRDRDTGYLFPAGDPSALALALEAVLAAKQQWAEMKVRARRYVETERSWERSVSNYLPLYLRLRPDLPPPINRSAHSKAG